MRTGGPAHLSGQAKFVAKADLIRLLCGRAKQKERTAFCEVACQTQIALFRMGAVSHQRGTVVGSESKNGVKTSTVTQCLPLCCVRALVSVSRAGSVYSASAPRPDQRFVPSYHRGASPIRKRLPLGSNRRPMPRVLVESLREAFPCGRGIPVLGPEIRNREIASTYSLYVHAHLEPPFYSSNSLLVLSTCPCTSPPWPWRSGQI